MSGPSKITEIPNPDKDKRLAAWEEMKRTWEIMRDNADVIAATRKRLFDAHVAAGFTPDQAFEVCKGFPF